MEVGEKIKQIRKEKGLTQQQLSKMSGLSRSYLGSIEINSNTPSLDALDRISKALNVSITTFIDNPNEIKEIEISKLKKIIRNLKIQTVNNEIFWDLSDKKIDVNNDTIFSVILDKLYRYDIKATSNKNGINYIIIIGNTNKKIDDVSEFISNAGEPLVLDDLTNIMINEEPIVILGIVFNNEPLENIIIDNSEIQDELNDLLMTVTTKCGKISLLDKIIEIQEKSNNSNIENK